MKRHLLVILALATTAAADDSAIMMGLKSDSLADQQIALGQLSQSVQELGKLYSPFRQKVEYRSAVKDIVLPYRNQLLAKAETQDRTVGFYATYLLTYLNPDRDIVDCFIRVAANSQSDVLSAAMMGLERVDPMAHPEAGTIVLKTLDASRPAAFDAASRVVAHWRMREAIPVLTSALDNQNPSIVEHAARSLGQMGDIATESVPHLEDALILVTNQQTRASIAGALKAIREASASDTASDSSNK